MRLPTSAAIVTLLLSGLTSAIASTETQISQATLDAEPYRLRTAVASSGSGYLVVWGASSGPNDKVRLDPPMTIYIGAIDDDGIPIPPFATAVGTGSDPSVVWNGHEYLVVWGITTPTTGSLPTPSVVGVRVHEDGTLVDAQPVTLISEVNPFSYVTTLAWNGSQYLLGWVRGMALVDVDLHAKLVSLPPTGGIPLYAASSGGDFIVLAGVLYGIEQTLNIVPVSSFGAVGTPIILDGPHAGIAGIDGGYALIWDDRSNLRYARLRPDGTMLSTSIVALGHAGLPHIAVSGGRIAATWEDASRTHVCTTRLDIGTQPVCSSGVQHDPSIAISSTTVLAAWSDHAIGADVVRVAVTPLSDVPRVSSSGGRSISDLQQPMPAAESRADGAMTAAWSAYNQSTKHFEVHIGGLSKGVSLPEHVVFRTALDQGSPAMAEGAGRTMVVWPEGPAASSTIRGTVVDDLSGAVIATLPLAEGTAPSVAFDGQEWLAAWQSADGVNRFAVVNRDGDPIASGALPANSVVQSSPAVAWSGNAFFATWRETVVASLGLPAYDRIQFATINTSAVPSASLTLDFAYAGLTVPSIASNGSRALVSWGTTSDTLRQALFDTGGRELGRLIDFAWPFNFMRTRTRAMPGGFATLAGDRIAVTSSDGRALGTIDVPSIPSVADFIVDPANRFTFLYSHTIGGANATFSQVIGMPRRRP
ncbi:MAG TPA: hypothetical protein VLC46_09580 [Thermoanaerobaculia bacterium]|jgi:hypothetical protein|nr:hypothetical protein [Thermoanaerobaculia bacterium]